MEEDLEMRLVGYFDEEGGVEWIRRNHLSRTLDASE
jgi:hypothetical protein